MSESEALENAIASLEEQRAVLGDAAVDAAIAGIRMQLASLEVLPESHEQRKQVTVLFADVSGFTAMSETMDPEDVREIMNALWASVDKIIVDYEGNIDKHIGDAVMAIWGSEAARENDPEQAIRAALAMQTAVESFAGIHNIPLSMHIGLNTGPVFLGDVGTTGEFTAMGDTVNTASRLEEAAPSGGVLVSHDTYRHVRGVFDVQPQEPLIVKGKSEPLQVYLVKQAKPRAFRVGSRGIEGIETKTVGRDRELGELITAYETTLGSSRTTAVTVTGEAGVGKSRLLYEFEQWLDLRPEQIRYFKSRASQQSRGIPQYLLRTALATRFQILDSDPIDILREKFVSGLAEFLRDDVEMKASMLGSWLGYDFSESPYLQPIKDDPEQIKNRATLYLTQFMTAVSLEAPTVILLEDIHWADGGSLDALIDLTRRAPDLPLLIVALARPSLHERLPDWGEKIPVQTQLELKPLSDEASDALVAELLRPINPLPEALHDLIASRSEGNPFYAEELVKMLIDDGVIIKEREDRWHVAPLQFQDLKVPATLTGVLQARLDKLQPAEKQAIQQASVIGRIFWDQALAVLSEDGPSTLPSLKAKEFIFPRAASAFAGADEYLFKHNILRDVTYETVLKRVGRRYHKLVAEWLVMAAETNGRLDEYAAPIGDHYRWAEERRQAASWYARAGLQAAAIFAHEEAVHYLSLALDFTEEAELRTRFNLLTAREKAYDMQGNRQAQQEDLEWAAALAEHLNVGDKARIALRQAHFAEIINDHTATIIHAQTAIELAGLEKDKSLAAAGYLEWGKALWQDGQHTAAQSKIEKGLQMAREANDYKQAAYCLSWLGNLFGERGEFATARDHWEQALVIMRKLGDRQGVSSVLGNLGAIFDKKFTEEALAITRDIGDRYREEITLGNLGFKEYERGDYVSAREYLEQSLAIAREIGARRSESSALLNLGHLAHQTDDYVEARRYYDQALAIAREIGNRWLEGLSLHELGALALVEGRPGLAEPIYRKALSIRQELEQPYYVIEDKAGLAKVSAALNDHQNALRYVVEVVGYLEGDPQISRAENLMRTLRFTWEVLVALGQGKEARQVLVYAAQTIEEYLAENNDSAIQEMYLRQPHHKVLWQAWQGKSEDKS